MTFALTMFCAGLNTSAEGQCRLPCVPVVSTGNSNVVDLRSSLRSLQRGYGDICSRKVWEMEKTELFWEKMRGGSK